MVKSISYSQDEIIDWILELHCKSPIELDPTFSKGNFYKTRPKPKFCFDIAPQSNFVQQADCRNLPLDSGIITTAILDGPFGIGSGPSLITKTEGQNITPGRFGCFPTGKILFDFYTDTLKEMYRVLMPEGVLILKIQPVVGCGKQWFTHFHCIKTATELGFYPKDEFVLLAKQRPISGKIKKQQHARKFHSYFYVLIKTKPSVDYANSNRSTNSQS